MFASPNTEQRQAIDFYLRANGAMVGLDDTHPAGDPMLAGLWTLAETACSNQAEWAADMNEDTAAASLDEMIAERVAQALLVVNFGPGILEDRDA